jgi:hypothetical protein
MRDIKTHENDSRRASSTGWHGILTKRSRQPETLAGLFLPKSFLVMAIFNFIEDKSNEPHLVIRRRQRASKNG